jgi:hypothetical protein
LVLNRLDQVSSRAQIDRARTQRRIVLRGEDDNPSVRRNFPQLLLDFESMHEGHRHVEHDEARLIGPRVRQETLRIEERFYGPSG